MSTAVVTGGAGFIGSWLVNRLGQDGWRVVVIDDLRSAPVDLLDLRAEWCPDARIDVITQSIHAFGQPPVAADAIFHLAGPVGPVGVLAQAGHIVPSIVGMAGMVASWAVGQDCPLVYVSTSEVYGGVGGACHESHDRIIAAGHSARQEYAVAKLAAETMLLNTGGLDVRIVRPFNVAGPRQSARGGFVTPRFVGQAMRETALTVYRPGTQLRAFTHVHDEVDGIIRALFYGRRGGIYNLGNPANRTTLADYAELVIDVVGSGYMTVVDPRELHGQAFHEAPDKYPAFSDAAADLGWLPVIGLREIITDVHSYMNRPRMLDRLGPS